MVWAILLPSCVWSGTWAQKAFECLIRGPLKGKHLWETAKLIRTSACLGISCTLQNLRFRIFLLNALVFSLNMWETLISAFQSMKLDCRRRGVTAWTCSFLDIICCNFFAVKQNSCSWSSPKIPDEPFPATLLQEWSATKCVEAWAVAHRVGSGEWGREPSLSTLVQSCNENKQWKWSSCNVWRNWDGLRLFQSFLWGTWRPEWV